MMTWQVGLCCCSGLMYEEVVAQGFFFFIAGYETTANALSLLGYSLAVHQDIQERVYKEIMEVTEGQVSNGIHFWIWFQINKNNKNNLVWWFWRKNVIQTQKCEHCQHNEQSTPFPAGCRLLSTWPSLIHSLESKHGRRLTAMPWTTTNEFNIIPNIQWMSLTSFLRQNCSSSVYFSSNTYLYFSNVWNFQLVHL